MAKGVYLRTKLLDSAVNALHASIDAYNRVYGNYRKEQALIIMSNAIELLGKALLLKRGQNIYSDRIKKDTIPAEKVISKLLHIKEIERIEAMGLQQIVSLRNAACHFSLPPVHDEIMQYLMFIGYKSTENIIQKHFKHKSYDLGSNYLSISSGVQLTYADCVEGLMKNYRKRSANEKNLAWLLGRGAAFIGTKYISQNEFEKQITNGQRKNLLDRSELGAYVKESEQIQVVLVQAPKGYSANVEIVKSTKRIKEALPVMIKKTNPNDDYPFFTTDLAEKTSKSLSFVSKSATQLNIKDNPQYSIRVKVNRAGSGIPKYNQAALEFVTKYFLEHPSYNPYF